MFLSRLSFWSVFPNKNACWKCLWENEWMVMLFWVSFLITSKIIRQGEGKGTQEMGRTQGLVISCHQPWQEETSFAVGCVLQKTFFMTHVVCDKLGPVLCSSVFSLKYICRHHCVVNIISFSKFFWGFRLVNSFLFMQTLKASDSDKHCFSFLNSRFPFSL